MVFGGLAGWSGAGKEHRKIRDRSLLVSRLVHGHMGVGAVCEDFCITL